MNDDEKYIEEFVKDIPFEDERAEHRDALRSQLLSAFPRHRLRPRTLQVPMWRTIMRTPMTKLAAAAAIVAVLWLGIHVTGRSSVAWAEVVRNIQNARTLVYQTIHTTEDGHSFVTGVMIRDPDRMRVESPDGKTWIVDLGEGRALVLDSKEMQATMSTTPQQTFSAYDALRNFQNQPDSSVRRLGRRMVEGMAVEGFELTRSDGLPITIYADLKTSLPVRIEQTVRISNDQSLEVVTTNISFDVDLDESLFSLEVPTGYTLVDAIVSSHSPSPLELRIETGMRMNEIMRACRVYVQEHNGQWPEQLQDLLRYGLASDALVNPRQPGLAIGYVYVKPDGPASPEQVVLYERYDVWGDGINVGCANGHIEFVKNENALKDRLE